MKQVKTVRGRTKSVSKTFSKGDSLQEMLHHLMNTVELGERGIRSRYILTLTRFTDEDNLQV